MDNSATYFTPPPEGASKHNGELARIRAAGRYHSGDIWFSVASAEEHTHLIQTANIWLPFLSNQLYLAHKTFPVIIHGVPTTFDTSCDSDEICYLLAQNSEIIGHPANLQHTEFISRSPSSPPKDTLLPYITFY
jgi:hypothetical protein